MELGPTLNESTYLDRYKGLACGFVLETILPLLIEHPREPVFKMSEKSNEKQSQHFASANGTESLSTSDTQNAELAQLGYQSELNRNRGMYTILFQSLAITAVPFGEGTALTSAIYGGGQLSYFVGWIVVSILDQCLFVSLAELASKFPTSAGP